MEKLTEIDIIQKANEVFSDPFKAHRWLNSPKCSLDNQSPASLLTSQDGINRVNEILDQIDSGIFI